MLGVFPRVRQLSMSPGYLLLIPATIKILLTSVCLLKEIKERKLCFNGVSVAWSLAGLQHKIPEFV